MARCGCAGFAFACALACGPDAAEPAELEDVCGEQGPFRILAHAEEQRLLGVRRIGDRSYFTLQTLVESHEDPEPSTRTVATGACGEAPREIARDVFHVFEHERWPGRLLGCNAPEGGAMLVLDPDGVAQPRNAMAAPACRGTPTEHGVVGVLEDDPASLTLVLVPWPADLDGDASEGIVLAEATRGEPFHPSYAVRGDDVFAVDADHDLVRIALPSGATSLEQPSVGEWGVSTDARVLAWRDFDPLVDPRAFVSGTLHLRDRVEGREIELEGVALHSVPPIASADWIGTRVDGVELTRFVELPSFSTLDLPGDHRVVSQLLDRRLLISDGARGPLAILDPHTGDRIALTDFAGGTRGGAHDHVDVFAAADASVPEAAVWRVWLDASPMAQLAERASSSWLEIDGRIVTPLDVDPLGIGDLVLIEPATLEERIIDDRVAADLQGHGAHAAFHERDIVYSVVDGERSGIWLARLEARE